MPSQSFSARSKTVSSPPEVWARLQVPATWEAISGVEAVENAEYDGSELVGFTFHSTAGGRRYEGTAKPGQRAQNETLEWLIATSEIKGSVQVDIEPSPPGSDIVVSMRVESVSMMATFGFPLIAAAIASGFQEAADEFASRLGSTESDAD